MDPSLYRRHVLSIAAILLTSIFVSDVAAQCGNFFKTGYRAVNRITFTANGQFRLIDWTGDGKSDFWGFRPHAGNSTADVVIYPALPTGYWNWDEPIILTTTLPSNISTLDPANTYTVRDFDSDGRMDFIIRSEASLTVYRNNGAGALIALAANNSLETGRFVDVNSDGILDLVGFVGIPNVGNELGYRLGNADGTFGPRARIFVTLETLWQFTVGDFNGDQRPDFLFIGSSDPHGQVVVNNGGGNFTIVQLTMQRYGTPVVADFNNDGRADVLIPYNDSPVGMSIFYGQANGSLTESIIPNVSNYSAGYKVADLNGDHNLDILQYNQDQYTTYINDGAGGFVRRTYSLGFVLDQGFAFEDFDGDGKADFWTGHTYSVFGEEVISIKNNVCSSSGETKRPTFDGTVFGDVVLWNQSTGNWSSREGDWSVTTNHPVVTRNWGGGSFGDVPVLGDFDGDSRTDYSVYRNPSGNWYVLLSSTSTLLAMNFGLPGDIPVPNDFDGGGKTDIAVYRPSEGNWYVWRTETQDFFSAHFGTNGDKPVPADYDGDGRTDLAVFRPSEGNWYWLRSSDQGFAAIQWGISTDKLVPGDYDGDGKADVAVFRSGTWYILRSYNGSYGVFYWGTTGDVPIPFNREGDMSELVLYRPSSRVWYNYRFPAVIQMGSNQDVPVNFGFPGN